MAYDWHITKTPFRGNIDKKNAVEFAVWITVTGKHNFHENTRLHGGSAHLRSVHRRLKGGNLANTPTNPTPSTRPVLAGNPLNIALVVACMRHKGAR